MKFRLTRDYDFCGDDAFIGTAGQIATKWYHGAREYLLRDEYDTEEDARLAWCDFIASAVTYGKAYLLDLTLTRLD